MITSFSIGFCEESLFLIVQIKLDMGELRNEDLNHKAYNGFNTIAHSDAGITMGTEIYHSFRVYHN